MAAFRFRITDVLFVTAAIAAGCAAAQIPGYSWFGGSLVAVCLLVSASTSRECITLDKAARSAAELSTDQRHELRFLAWGRFAVVLLLAAILAIDLLVESEVIELSEGEEGFPPDVGRRARNAAIDLALLICIVSPTFGARNVPKSLWRSAVNSLAIGTAAILTILIATQEALVHWLVFLAVWGIEQTQVWEQPAPLASASRFAYLLMAHAVAVLAIIATVQFSARQWHFPRLRISLLLAAVIGLAAIAWSTVRLVSIDLGEISPAMREAITIGPIHRWVTTVSLILMASAVWTYLTVRRSRIREAATSISLPNAWRGRVLAPSMILVLYTCSAALFVYEFIDNPIVGWNWQGPFAFLTSTEYYTKFAVWVASVALLYRTWRERKSEPAVVLHGLPFGQFVTLLLFNVALAAVGGFVIAWLSFALWLTPWYRWFG